MPILADVDYGYIILDEKRAVFEGPSAVHKALVACSRLPPEFRIDCSFNRGSDGDHVGLTFVNAISSCKTPSTYEQQ